MKTKAKKPKTVWICLACGKASNDKYGKKPLAKGWDAGCVCNAIEVLGKHVTIGQDGIVQAMAPAALYPLDKLVVHKDSVKDMLHIMEKQS